MVILTKFCMDLPKIVDVMLFSISESVYFFWLRLYIHKMKPFWFYRTADVFYRMVLKIMSAFLICWIWLKIVLSGFLICFYSFFLPGWSRTNTLSYTTNALNDLSITLDALVSWCLTRDIYSVLHAPTERSHSNSHIFKSQ